MFRITLIIFAVVSAIAYTTISSSDSDYAVDIREARRLLMASEMPHFVFGSQGPTFEVRAEGAQVQWIAKRGGVEFFRYIATLTELGADKTRVELELKGSKSGGSASVASKLAEKPSIQNLYVVAMREQIAATLERRPFDMTQIASALAIASAGNMSSMRSSLDEAATASEQRAKESIQRAYREEAQGNRR